MKQKVVIAVMMLFTLSVVHAPQVLFSEGMILYVRFLFTAADGSCCAASFSYSKIIKVGHNTEFNINITPNPVTAGFINLALSSVNTSTVIISITNMNGKIVYTHQFTSTSDYLTETINVNGLGKGMYVLKAVNGNISKTMKFMKE